MNKRCKKTPSIVCCLLSQLRKYYNYNAAAKEEGLKLFSA